MPAQPHPALRRAPIVTCAGALVVVGTVGRLGRWFVSGRSLERRGVVRLVCNRKPYATRGGSCTQRGRPVHAAR